MRRTIQYCSACNGVIPTWVYSEEAGWEGVYIEGAFWCPCENPCNLMYLVL